MFTAPSMSSPAAPGARRAGRTLAVALGLCGAGIVTSPALAQSGGSTAPLALRPGSPKVWEDPGTFWSGASDYAFAPSGNLQNRIGLFHWYPPGTGAPIQVTLFHNSADSTRQRGLGFGFRIGPAARLSVAEDGTVTIEEADGTPIVFSPAPGGYVPETFETSALTQDASGYVLRARGGFERIFADPHALGYVEVARRDRTGDTVTFTYDSTNNLVRIGDSAGREAVLTRQGGLYTQLRDPLGAVFSLLYSKGELVTVVGPEVGGVSPRLELTYDLLTHVILERGSWGGTSSSRFSYYADRRLRTASPDVGLPIRIDYTEGEVAVTDALNRSTVLKFAHGAFVELIQPGGLRVATARDDRLRPVAVLDEVGHLYSYAYDDADNVVATSDEVSSVRTFLYDERHNILEETDHNGLTKRYTYNAFDEVTSEESALLERTEYLYDAEGNLIEVRDFAGVTRYRATYNGTGRVLTETNQNGRTWTYGYDAYGNLTSVTEPDLLTSVTQTVGPLGHPTSVTNALGETTEVTYDELNRPMSAAQVGGGVVSVEWDLDGRVTGIDNSAGPTSLEMSRTFAGKSSVATVETNGVQVQGGPAATTGIVLYPVEGTCEPSCGLRCGEGIPDTCGGVIDCGCPAGLTCNTLGFCGE